MIRDVIAKYDLDNRISEKSDKILLIFDNKPLMEWCKRWFKGRNDIIYMTTTEIYNRGLVGLRYRRYEYADEVTLMKLKKGLEVIKNDNTR